MSVVSRLRAQYKKNVEKNVGKKTYRYELCEARTHAIESKIEHRDHLTVLPKIHIIIIFRGARETHDTPHTHAQHSKRETVMTDDGSQPPIEQLATAVHRGPATRSWCGPLLVVLLGGVVMFSACCLMSRCLG